MSYLRSALGPTPVTEPLPGQVANSGGGHSFAVDDWSRLVRFLILGSEGGSYYATERKLTAENCQAVKRCIAADGERTVRTIVEVSDAGRAPKNDPAILALALCLKTGNEATRRAAQAAVPLVCRIGTHILHLAAFVNEIGGWGRGTKRAFANWYRTKSAHDLAYQLVKYQSRDGWSNRDVLRLAHPQPPSVDHAVLFAWACGKEVDETLVPSSVAMFEALKRTPTVNCALDAIIGYNLPREAIPTELLKEPKVWEALLPKMGLTALIRNLATMTRIGLLQSGSDATARACERITNAEHLTKSRVHPIAILAALKTYQSGKSVKGTSTWTPVQRVVDALDAAFYASFGSVVGTGKRIELCLDVSGSMSQGTVACIPGLSPREASAAMAMVTLASEPNATVSAFSTRYIRDVPISPRRRLDDNVRAISHYPFARTDCSLPMLMGMKENRKVDAFVVYTDSETNSGIHPPDALREYRRRSGIGQAKLAVVAMESNGFTIADPNDAGMLDVVGFDTATPNILSDFIA
jgi:60 kDa SS-A/Ro ribonucleoprotein